jgi:hypothetical protein
MSLQRVKQTANSFLAQSGVVELHHEKVDRTQVTIAKKVVFRPFDVALEEMDFTAYKLTEIRE